MNRVQKIAWSIVITTLLGLALSLITFARLYPKYGGTPKTFAAFSFMGIVGLSMFSPIIFREDKGTVKFDERDKLIQRNAAWAGFAMSNLFFALACFIPFYILGANTLIRVNWLPSIYVGATLIYFITWAVAILVQYGWGDKSGE